MNPLDKSSIIDYYESCETDYRIFWDLERSMAMHAGYWDETTYSLHQALIRENEILARAVGITASDHILDAGCGVGGSSIFLAKHYDCPVVGITLSHHQVDKATKNAANISFNIPPRFFVRDFTDTHFDSESFDVVWAIESVCHAKLKEDFIREAFRVLKPGGRLMVADGFANAIKQNSTENWEMHQWLKGWGVQALETKERFNEALQKKGFVDIAFEDITEHVKPSSKRLYRIFFPGIILSTIGEWVGLRKPIQTANIRAAYYQYKTLQQQLWKYGYFIAKKPH